MSNGRYTYCPFYIDENKRSISCEDVCRHFSSLDEKYGWMRQYCDTMEWERCPFAVDLTEAYYRKEKGDEKALEKEKIKAMESEIRSLSTKLGTAEKRNERLHKKVDELRAVNQTLTQNNINLGEMNKKYLKRWRDERAQLEDYQKHESERYFRMAMLYEDRIAYLIDTCCDGRLAEADVKAWAEGKEYALTFDKDEEDPVWIVKTRKETEADEDVSEPVQGAAKNEGPAVKK